MKTSKLIICTAIATTFLTACGGGASSASAPAAGGGPTYGVVPTAAVQINATNAAQVSKSAYGSVNTMSSASSTGSSGTRATGTAAGQANTKGLAKFASGEILGLYGKKFAVVPLGVAGSGTPVSCTGGGTRTSALTVDANANGRFDIGDTVTITYAGCSDGAGTTETGAMSFKLNRLTNTATVMDFSATITFNRLKTVTAAEATDVTGDMTLVFTQDSTTATAPVTTMTVSGNSFDSQSTIHGVEQMTAYNMTITIRGNTSMSMSIGMTTAMAGATATSPQGKVTISTPNPFTIDMATGALTAGSIRFTGAGTGANGSYVEITPSVGSTGTCDVTVNDPTATPAISTRQVACSTVL